MGVASCCIISVSQHRACFNDAERGVFKMELTGPQTINPWHEVANLAIYKIDLSWALELDF